MTKAELIEALEQIGDDEEVFAMWDDCQWSIDGTSIMPHENTGELVLVINADGRMQ